MEKKPVLCLLAAILLVGSVSAILAAEPCSPLNDVNKQSLINYVQAKYKVAKTSPVRIAEDTALPDCYHKLRFVSDAAGRNFTTTLFLSPDYRYLAPTLFDSRSDPLEEERQANLAIQASLTKGDFASIGPKDAPVTIVEFSDFQCPYCRQAAQFVHEIVADPGARNVRFIFRHFPLQMHPWAQTAAEAAACARLQNTDAFWKLHDFIFANQSSITVDNIQSKLLEQVKRLPIDEQAYQNCVDNSMSMGLVAKDADLGVANQVRGTPTLFVNGKRLPGVRSADDLRAAISEALQQAAPARPAGEANQ